jgi:FtsH-binding integral membrane protein
MAGQVVGPARERVREGTTMALYVSLSLLAVTAALPSDLSGSGSDPATVLFLTSLGLILAHAFAFRVSARLVDRGRLAEDSLEILGAQLAGGAAVTVVALVPIVLLGAPDGVRVAGYLLVGFVALVGYLAARSAEVGRGRALGYVAGVVVVAVVVLWVKSLVGH